MDPLTLSLISAGIGAGGNILGGLFGSNAAAKAAQQQQAAIAQAQGYTQQGTDAAVAGIQAQQPYLDQGYAAQTGALGTAQGTIAGARGNFAPYIAGGQGANTLVNNALGVNGQPAQQDYYKNFQTDPGWQAANDYAMQGLQASAAAKGGLNTGAMAKDLYGFGQTNMLGAYSNRIAQLQGQAGTGLQAGAQDANLAGTSANLSQAQGNAGQQYYGASGAIPLAVGQAKQAGDMSSANYAVGAGNAAANGTMAAGNAWTNALSGAGAAAGNALGYYAGRQSPSAYNGGNLAPPSGYGGSYAYGGPR